MSGSHLNSERRGPVTVVHMGEEYDALAEVDLAETETELLHLADTIDPPHLVLDFAATRYFSSAFLELLFRVSNRLNRRRGRFAICNLRGHCREVFTTARLDKFWGVYSGIDEAINSLGPRDERTGENP